MPKFSWNEQQEASIQKPAGKPGKFSWDAQESAIPTVASSKSDDGSLFDSAQAGLEHFGNAASLGYMPQFQGIISKIAPDPNADLDERLRAQGFKIDKKDPTYVEERDAYIKHLKEQESRYPIASTVGTIGGAITSGIATSGLAPVAAATNVGRVAQAGKVGAALAAASNPGDVHGKISPVQLDDRARNTVLGYGLGAGGQVLAEGGGALAGQLSQFLRNKAAAKAARAVGRPTPTQAKIMSANGDDVAMGRELLDQGAIPVLGTPNRIAKNVDALKEKSWEGVERILGRGGDNTVVDGTEAGMKILNSEELKLLREAGETQAVKALEDAADQLAGMGNLTLEKAQKIKRTIDSQINYNKAIPDMTGGQAARVTKRSALRDQMDEAVTSLGGEKNELKNAFKKHGLLEKASDIAEREAGREQANRSISLTDTIMGAAGMAKGEPMTGIALAAANKFGRTFGNSMQARAYDAAAKQLAKIPEYAAMAEKNPSAFAASVEKLAERFRSEPTAIPQMAESDNQLMDRAPSTNLKGEAKWMQSGADKLGLGPDQASRAMATKEGKRLLIEASDLSPTSKRTKEIQMKILRGDLR